MKSVWSRQVLLTQDLLLIFAPEALLLKINKIMHTAVLEDNYTFLHFVTEQRGFVFYVVVVGGCLFLF